MRSSRLFLSAAPSTFSTTVCNPPHSSTYWLFYPLMIEYALTRKILCVCSAAGSMPSIRNIISNFPETLLSLGPKESGMLLFNNIVKLQDKPHLLNFLLDGARERSIPLLLPYTFQVAASLALPFDK